MRTGLRTNVLRRPLVGQRSAATSASPEAVYELLAGSAIVGTEFEGAGEGRRVRSTDRSVVTEATPPASFEFVTDSSWELARSGARADLTVVHRYEIERLPGGCRLTYTFRATRASALPGHLAVLRVPVLRAAALRMRVPNLREGFRGLLRAAERRPNRRRSA
ncbi:MAG: hypothetical protein WD770_02860 [Actinomycetota bacterium]